MKTERRHSLETNELAAGLTQWIEKLKPYTGQMLTGLLLFVGVYIGLAIYDSYDAQRQQEAWNAFALANSANDQELKGLQGVAGDEKYDGTDMQEWAYVGWADRQVLLAQNFFLLDRERSNERLLSAQGIYEAMSTGASDPQVKNRARFGLARIYEMQNKIDDAREQYLLVRGALQPQASERAKQLDSEAVREACSWLATAELPKLDLTGGQGATGVRPDFSATTPAADEATSDAATKSLEELLGEFNSGDSDEDRYKESNEETSESDDTSASEESTEPAAEEQSDAAQE